MHARRRDGNRPRTTRPAAVAVIMLVGAACGSESAHDSSVSSDLDCAGSRSGTLNADFDGTQPGSPTMSGALSEELRYYMRRGWAQQWPCEEVWVARRR